jgi:hypothetical protein
MMLSLKRRSQEKIGNKLKKRKRTIPKEMKEQTESKYLIIMRLSSWGTYKDNLELIMTHGTTGRNLRMNRHNAFSAMKFFQMDKKHYAI